MYVCMNTGTPEEHHVKMEADIGVIYLKGKECQRLQQITRS